MRKSIPMPQGTEKPGRWEPPRTHRNEFPTGYSLAGRSPALPTSASPAKLILQLGAHIWQVSQKRAQYTHKLLTSLLTWDFLFLTITYSQYSQFWGSFTLLEWYSNMTDSEVTYLESATCRRFLLLSVE